MKLSKIFFLFLVLLILFGCSSRSEYHAQSIIAQLEEKPVARDRTESKRVFRAPKEDSGTQTKSSHSSNGNYRQIAAKTFTFPPAKSVAANDIALIIGIAKYDSNPDVANADNSAYAFRELALRTLGIPEENIIMLLNEQATSGKVKSSVALAKELVEKGGNLYFYYAGHGVPAKDGNTYLLPYDMSADSIHLEPKLKMDTIYKTLESSLATNVFAFADACFSGKDDSGNLLYEGVAPVMLVKTSAWRDKKTILMTAGGPSDFANDYSAKHQRMFTYFLIESITSGDTKIGPIYDKVRRNVKRASLRKGLGYKQIPQLIGDRHLKLD